MHLPHQKVWTHRSRPVSRNWEVPQFCEKDTRTGMTVLITCGFQKSWCTIAQTLLQDMGLAEPVIANRVEATPDGLTSRMCQQHRVSVSKPGTLHQVTPGKTWQIMAAELFVANSEQDNWGWADPRNIFFLDFWRDFDPLTRFVLIYGSPAQSLSCTMDEGEPIPDDLDQALAGWVAYHDALLRFYNRNRERSFLVHIDAFEQATAAVADRLNRNFDTDMRRINTVPEKTTPQILQLIAQTLLTKERKELTLYAELESTSDLPAQANGPTKNIARSAHDEYLSLRGALAAQSAEAGLREELEKARENLEEATAAVTIKSRENDLMLRQLHQVQEELENYFTKYQQLKRQSESLPAPAAALPRASVSKPLSAPATASPRKTGVNLDMRSFINGRGWHSPENHGRWAGAELTSTLALPELEPGTYRLDIEIIDGMSLDIVRDLRISFDDQVLATRTLILSNMGGRLAPLRRLKAQMRNVDKPYPITVTASIPESLTRAPGGGHSLHITSPKVISPLSLGIPDTRNLSICVKTVKITRVS